jgi:hypothetical protein
MTVRPSHPIPDTQGMELDAHLVEPMLYRLGHD